MKKIEIGGKEYIVSSDILPMKHENKSLVEVIGLHIEAESLDYMDDNDDWHGRKYRAIAAVKIGDVMHNRKNVKIISYPCDSEFSEEYYVRFTGKTGNIVES